MKTIVLLLHGYGSDDSDMRGLAAELNVDVEWIVPRGPIELPWGGFAWFDIEFTPTSKRYDMDQASGAADDVIALARNLRDQGSKVIVGGFSQGGMIALGACVRAPELFSGLFVLSGAVLAVFEIVAVQEQFATMPKLIQHGTLDEVVPLSEARRTCEWLNQLHCQYELKEYEMMHQVTLDSLRDLRRWLLTYS